MSDSPDRESSSSTLGPAPSWTGGVATLSPLSDIPLSQENSGSGSGAEGVQEVDGEGPGEGESLALLLAEPASHSSDDIRLGSDVFLQYL